MEGLDFDVGTGDMCCDCSTSEFCYEPVGHIVTGDLTIIRDAKLRALIGKGPSYREQNFVDWKKICSEAVAANIMSFVVKSLNIMDANINGFAVAAYVICRCGI